jgi:microcystin-dependent protein
VSTSPFLDTILPAPAPADYRYIWAKVTQTSPLRIQVDGDRDPLPITPDDLGGNNNRPLNQRVYCQILNRRLVVLGPVVIPAQVDLTPPGTIHEFAGSVLPAGYLWAEGAAVSRTTYAALYAALGGLSSPWGQGDGSTTFNVPNRKGRVAVGRDATQTEFDTLGETGGAKTHTLAEAEIPSHTHAIDHDHAAFFSANSAVDAQMTVTPATTNPASSGSLVRGSGTGTGTNPLGGSGHNHSISIPNYVGTSGAKGGGGAHNNLQPYVVVNYIIKT